MTDKRYKILLAGESWVSTATHIKGFDQFSTVTFHLGAEPLVEALKGSAFDLRYMPAHEAQRDFPQTPEAIAAYDAVILSDIGSNTLRIFADAHVKHGAHAIVQDRSIPELVRDVEFFSADAIIATGQRTGHVADLDYIRTIKSATSLPTLVGSGVTSENVGDILDVVDGVIVASALKVDGRWWNAVDRERANRFVDRAGR